MMHRFVRLIVIGALVTVHAGCSRPFFVRPVGSLAAGLTFHFFDKLSDSRPSAVQLTDILVQRHFGSDRWATVWQLKGSARLEAVTFGKSAAGLHESSPPEPLDPTGQYRAIASATFFRMAGHAVVFFAFNLDGSVRQTEAVFSEFDPPSTR